jgi:hypothetical protein
LNNSETFSSDSESPNDVDVPSDFDASDSENVLEDMELPEDENDDEDDEEENNINRFDIDLEYEEIVDQMSTFEI